MRLGFAIPIAAGVAILAGLTATFEYPPTIFIQNGFRGTAMATVYNPPRVRAELAANQVPASLPEVTGGPPAGRVYQNVQVLQNDSVAAFTRLMASITTWVSPQQGCGFCHEAGNFASDKLWTKVVARRMIQMVQHINGNWTSHVAGVGVTCYTCHRGQPIPANVWLPPDPPHAPGMVESLTGKNLPAQVAGLSSLPYDPITPYLTSVAASSAPDSIRVESTTPLPQTDRKSIKQTEWTYALMMHFSQSLGVNCTFCHNTRIFGDWGQSTQQRVIAWHGIQMVRELNATYLEPLSSLLPADQHGRLGEGPVLDCATCHQGVYKPLFGAPMAVSFPELGLAPQSAAATTETKP
ncbi:MAG: photosynthetic reaction center cytochrome c subunit [Acetobacteraceae bacterium]|nr:photosynthetic reaction center cytochrome c subunit [Acetobacteraceae bacterium]